MAGMHKPTKTDKMKVKELTEKEFLEKYGDLTVVFSNYYKYTFAFEGVTADGLTVVISYGGSADDIYRFDIDAGKEYTIKSLGFSYASVHNNEELIEECYNNY